MVEAIEEQAGQSQGKFWPTAGTVLKTIFKYLARRHIDGYVATERQKHGYDGPACKRGPLPKGTNAVARMKRKLQTRAGRRIYAMRKAIVEPVFGQIKQAARKLLILKALSRTQGNRSAAELLGLESKHLLKLMKSLQIE